ncbi:ATP-binding protein [Bradyrhizobium genosp. P]|uniref:ATP-binding protein n=1 Tax=Bradyrhizobium genosp. P TaxID=83641 RepID=UPI003CE751DE
MLERANTSERTYFFGPFQLLAGQKVLLEGDRPVRLGGRALQILIALVERAGELVSKRELVAIVWPDTIVVEANLAVHVGSLRRALGDGQSGARYIVNAPGRGYRFVAPIRFADRPIHLPPSTASPVAPNNLPPQATRLIGRGPIVAEISQKLLSQRLLTVVGPPGIGKTALTLGVAEHLLSAFEHGIWQIDLAPIGDSSLVASTLASVLRIEIRSGDPIPGLLAALRDRRMLVVFDNCEHVIDAAASLVAAVLKGSRGVHVLATSREPLRVEGEQVYRLSPLECPPPVEGMSAAEVLAYPAVQLFSERAAAATSEFDLMDEDAPAAGRICRELDGNPLAIELAAARVDTFGVRGLAARLDDRLPLLTESHRGTPPRHRTIGAALDWSYQLLDEREKAVFRHLAVFTGGFTLESASAVSNLAGEADVAGIIALLVQKSLVAAEIGEKAVRFRLLEIARAFAMARLIEDGEKESTARRHADYFVSLVQAKSDNLDNVDFAEQFAPDVDNLRGALSWAFAPGGDRSLAVALVAGSARIWLEMPRLSECRIWVEKALEILDLSDRGKRPEMVLQAALGFALMFTQGMTDAARKALTTANELAEGFGDRAWQLQTLVDLTIFCHRVGDNRGALALARRAETIAQVDVDARVARATTDGITCGSLFFVGDHAAALTYGRRAHSEVTPAVRRAQINRWGLDYSIYARCVVGRALMHQGLFDQAAETARDVIAEAEAFAHPTSLCQALIWSCSIAVGLDDLDTADILLARLRDQAERNGLNAYHVATFASEGRVRWKRGDIEAGERLLRTGIEKLRQAKFESQYVPFLDHLAEVLAASGRFDESLAAADEALQRVERNSMLWWLPEALRVKGEALLVSPCRALEGEAEDHFRRSLKLARSQQALMFELRSAVSLGRLFASTGRRREGYDILQSVYSGFTEGFRFADVQRAKSLLQELRAD